VNWQALTNYANQSNYNRNSLSLSLYIYMYVYNFYTYIYTHTHIYIYIWEPRGKNSAPYVYIYINIVHVGRHRIPAFVFISLPTWGGVASPFPLGGIFHGHDRMGVPSATGWATPLVVGGRFLRWGHSVENSGKAASEHPGRWKSLANADNDAR
jgi:hypothetical protein